MIAAGASSFSLGPFVPIVTSTAFWEAVIAIGSITSLIFIYRQLKTAKDVSALDFLLKEEVRFRSEEFRRSRSELARRLIPLVNSIIDGGPKTSAEIYNAMSDDAEEILDYYEELGMMVRRGIVDKTFMWTFRGRWIQFHGLALGGYIRWSREHYGDGTLWDDFERLVTQMIIIERREGETPISDEAADKKKAQLLRFLQDDELQLHLERMKIEDLNQLLVIEKICFNKIDAYSKDDFLREFDLHPRGFVVATIQGQLVGYVLGYVESGEGEIDSIAVDPDFQEIGVGRRLLVIIEESFRTAGVEYCHLQVRERNTNALEFYRGNGFRSEKLLNGYYSDGENAFELRRRLSDSVPS